MKRHKSLMPLSHDHHHGLILAQLIKKGAPEYKDLPKDPGHKKAYALDVWENELKKHFDNEEKILFPFIAGRSREIDILINEILNEHAQIKSLFNSLETGNNFQEILDEIGILLDNHIRKEERELFRIIQDHFSDSELNELNGKLNPVKNN